MMEMCLVGKNVYEAILQIAPWLRPAVGTPRKFLYLPQMASLVHLDAGTIPEKRKRTARSVLKGYTPTKW